MKMNDIKDALIIGALAVLAVVGWLALALFAVLLTAAPFVLIVAGCLYAWKAIIE